MYWWGGGDNFENKALLCRLYYSSNLHMTIFSETKNGCKRCLVTTTRLCEAHSH